jgi:hypothetical protein
VAALQTPGDGIDLQLALHGPDPAPDLPDLVARLTETGANRVDRLRVAAPDPGKRDAGGLLTELTLAVGGVANLATIFDSVYKWLGARKTRATRQPAPPEAGDQVPSVVLTIGGDSITLVYPPDWVQSQAVKRFLEEHGQDEDQS